jgi:predicted secreted hydrolase
MSVHTALTDIEAKAFHHAVYQPLTDVTKVDNGFQLSQANQHIACGGGHDTLHGEGSGFSFDVDLNDAKRPTLQDGSGYLAYSFGGYTYYYSREHMAATGTVVVGGKSFPVTGTGWFDHQYGDLTNIVSYGWDWFAIQLDDNRELMLFWVHQGSNSVAVGASLTDANCVTTELGANDIEEQSLGSWKSPHTGCTYPSGWHVRVLDMEFDILPDVADQELSTAVPIYWEGASTVTGSATGRAYVELSGYCPKLP